MKYVSVAISSLKHDSNNARKHDDRNIELIMTSLKQHGQRKPLVVHDGIVIAGNGTLEAAKRLGWTEIDVNAEPFPSLEAVRAYAIQDNRTAETATWDFDILGDQLKWLETTDWDMSGIGFSVSDFTKSEIDYGILDDGDASDGILDDLRNGTRKAIQIEFEQEHYDEAFELVKWWRAKGSYVGMMLMDKLKSEKDKHETQ